MTSVIVFRLVVPTWAPNRKPRRPLTVVTLAIGLSASDDDGLVDEVVAVGQVDRLGAARREYETWLRSMSKSSRPGWIALSNGTTIHSTCSGVKPELLAIA